MQETAIFVLFVSQQLPLNESATMVLLLKKFTRKRQKKALRYSIGKLKSYICLHAHFGLNA